MPGDCGKCVASNPGGGARTALVGLLIAGVTCPKGLDVPCHGWWAMVAARDSGERYAGCTKVGSRFRERPPPVVVGKS